MSTIRKKKPVKYNKTIHIYRLEPRLEQKVKATMVAHGFPSISAAVRYLLEHRKVDVHFIEYSLDDAMWLFTAVRQELQLLEISIAQIKKKMAAMNIMHVNENVNVLKLFEESERIMEISAKRIFDIITKLSYLWLPE